MSPNGCTMSGPGGASTPPALVRTCDGGPDVGDASWQRRFFAKIDTSGGHGGCWPWTASTSGGYGQFQHPSGMTRSHRVMYELAVGPIPEGLHIDHLCRNRACVNPYHLEAVTPGENTRRGIKVNLIADANLAKTHCPYGHPYDEENTYVWPRTGWRQCKICMRERLRRRRARSKAQTP